MRGYCVSHIGNRPNHEDNFLFDGRFISTPEQGAMPSGVIRACTVPQSGVQFYAVSDGMGGHNAGEAASLICVSKLAALEPTVQNCASIRDVVSLCQKTIADINAEVCQLSRANASQKGMGATLVLLIFCGSECAALNIGDSRAYFFDGTKLTQITKDNTEGQRMLDLNLLSNNELRAFPARKSLNRYIGFDESNFALTADEYAMSIQTGVYMLCSDGVTDSLADDEIADLLRNGEGIETAGRQIISHAVSSETSDNATVILISAEG
jgi:protein phosphatase